MTKPRSLRAFLCVGEGSRRFTFQATACATTLCLVVYLSKTVHADQSASPQPPSTNTGSQSSPQNPAIDSDQATAGEGHSLPDHASQAAPATAKPADARSGEVDRAVPARGYQRGDALVRTALAFRGRPYRWGGTSSRSGFDCSGLVQTVYAKWGIYLPRCASQQVSQGVPVPKDQLQPGDLVFFKNTYKRGLSHVGIYVGDGWFIHAADRRKGVIMSRLDQGYHKTHWYGARRLNLSKLPPVPDEEKQPQKVIIDPPLP